MKAASRVLTGGERVIATLEELGAEIVVGLPGQHALPLFDALHDSRIRLLSGHVESNAAFMADGAARRSGAVTPLLLSAGPGALAALPGVQEAAAACSPVLIVAAQIPSTGIGRRHGYLHELPSQAGHFEGIVKACLCVRSTEQLDTVLRRGWELAATVPMGPVYVEIPADVLASPSGATIAAPGPTAAPARRAGTGGEPWAQQVAALLQSARRPRILAGGGVVRSGACAELASLAERCAAPVVTTFGGRSGLPWRHPLSAQGWIEDIATTEFLEEADVLLVVGTGMGELSSNYFRLRPRGSIVHIDADPTVIGENHETGIAVAADARVALTTILAALDPDGAAQSRERVAQARADIEALIGAIVARLDAQELDHERGVMSAIRGAVPASSATFWDMTIAAYWAWSCWDAQDGAFETAQCGGLGFALPAAIGAAASAPSSGNAPVLAVTGDGGALYGISELAALARTRADVTWLIVDDGKYGVLDGYMHDAFDRATATALHRVDFAALARAFGVEACTITVDELPSRLADAMRRPGPSVLHLRTRLQLFAPTHLSRAPCHRGIAA